MMKRMTMVLVGMFALASSGGVFAFDINPIDEHCWGRDWACQLTRKSDRFFRPVHETMTVLAYDCLEAPGNCSGYDPSRVVPMPPQTVRSFIIGSEWNDDPDSLIRQGVTAAVVWWSMFDDAKKWADCKKHPRPGCRSIEDPLVLYRSHFGDLQFLHAMASTDDEEASTTRGKMMAWAHFTYSIYVSSREINVANQTISSFDPEISKIINKPGWTVGALFDPARVGEILHTGFLGRYGHYESYGRPRIYNHSKDISVREIALGSLLHMIQDSYSESHVYREFGCQIAVSTKGRITLFRNYASQNPDHHRVADRLPDWIGRHAQLKTNNPVWASAQLLHYASRGEPWEKTVRDFLETEVFPVTNPRAKPDPANKNCWTPE